MTKHLKVCGNKRDDYTDFWVDAIIYYLSAVCMIFSFVQIGLVL